MTDCDRCLNSDCEGRVCLADFGEWLEQLLAAKPTRERVKILLQDAYWKGQLEGTEIKRSFLLQRAGIQIVPELHVK